MIAPDQSKGKREKTDGRTSRHLAGLPFRIELWDKEKKNLEQVVARAHSAALAQAIFNAACQEYPDAHLSLWRGRERIAEKKP
jgi:hypothetical protein